VQEASTTNLDVDRSYALGSDACLLRQGQGKLSVGEDLRTGHSQSQGP
jgi:hypothetical protein